MKEIEAFSDLSLAARKGGQVFIFLMALVLCPSVVQAVIIYHDLANNGQPGQWVVASSPNPLFRGFDVDVNGDGVRELRFGFAGSSGAVYCEQGTQILANAFLAPYHPNSNGAAVYRLSADYFITENSPGDYLRVDAGPGISYEPGWWGDWVESQNVNNPGLVAPSKVFYSSLSDPAPSNSYGNAFRVSRGYAGFRTQINGEWHYGWIDLANITAFNQYLVYGWAYETEPNTGILAGAIPEPGKSSLVCMALALTIMRRRRQALLLG